MKLSDYQVEIKLGLVFAVVALAFPNFALATVANSDFGSAAASFGSSELSQAPLLASSAAYITGAILTISGILKMKAHSENPGQTPLSHGLGRLGAGGALLAMPNIAGILQSTMTQGGSAAGYTSLSASLN